MQAAYLRRTAKGNFFGETTQQYQQRIERARQEAIEYEKKMKELEVAET